MTDPTQLPTPSYLPSGYLLAERVDGAEGFGSGPNQVSLFYRRSLQSDDVHYPLVVYIAPSGSAELAATEGGPSQPLDLNVPAVTAVYHDGMWAPGGGDSEKNIGGQTVIHWEGASGFHSITAHTATNTFGVRAPKNRGVGFDELVKVVRSLCV